VYQIAIITLHSNKSRISLKFMESEALNKELLIAVISGMTKLL